MPERILKCLSKFNILLATRELGGLYDPAASRSEKL
jgi:hypothetical protein